MSRSRIARFTFSLSPSPGDSQSPYSRKYVHPHVTERKCFQVFLDRDATAFCDWRRALSPSPSSIYLYILPFPFFVLLSSATKVINCATSNGETRRARSLSDRATHRVTSHRGGNVSRRYLREDSRSGRNGNQLTIEHALRYFVVCMWMFLLK